MRNMGLKVFCGSAEVDGKPVSVIVAASSQRKASAALAEFGIDESVKNVQAHWTTTANEAQRVAALAAPGKAFSSSPGSDDYKPLPRNPIIKVPQPPKIPKDPEGKKQYNKVRRETSDAAKRERGERRISAWLPPHAAEALDELTGGDDSRGAVTNALILALTRAVQVAKAA